MKASAIDATRYFARNLMTRGLRHASGMAPRQPIQLDFRRFGQRASLIDDCKRTFSPGHRSATKAPAAWIAASRARPALRAKLRTCLARLRKDAPSCSGMIRVSLLTAPDAESALAGWGSSAEDNLISECLSAWVDCQIWNWQTGHRFPFSAGRQPGDHR